MIGEKKSDNNKGKRRCTLKQRTTAINKTVKYKTDIVW